MLAFRLIAPPFLFSVFARRTDVPDPGSARHPLLIPAIVAAVQRGCELTPFSEPSLNPFAHWWMEADMQKIVATFLASLLLVPAGSFAQDSKVNDGRMIEGTAVTASIDTLRESAIRQARLAVATDAPIQAPKGPSWPSRHPAGFGALVGAGIGAGVGLAGGGNCGEDCGGGAKLAVRGAIVGAFSGSLTALVLKVMRAPSNR